MIQSRQQAQAATAPTNGAHGDMEALPSPPARRRSLRAWTLWRMVIALVPVTVFAVLYAYHLLSYISTDNALVTGTLVQLGPLTAAQVRTVTADVGDEVIRNQQLATVFTASGQLQSLRAPFDGVVVARYANPGDALTAGKAALAVLNTDELWVEARVEEWQATRIRQGQTAEVTIDALGQTVRGQVFSVGSASIASLSGQQSGPSFGAGRPRQLVPVRVSIDHADLYLFYGGLATVKFHLW